MSAHRLQKAILGAMVCMGCAMPRPAYRTDVKIAPAGVAHQYTVEFRLSEIGRNGASNLVIAPKLTVIAGQEAHVLVGDDEQRDAISCTALVREGAKSLDATTDVDVRRHGRTVWHNTQSVALTQP
jgi:hypothetical protein